MASTGEAWRPIALGVTATALMPVLFVTVAAAQGLGLSPDSLGYLHPSRNVGLEFLPWWPVGFPLLLLVIGSGAAAVILNCFAAAAYVWSTFVLAVEVSGSRVLALTVAAWVALSVATTQTFVMLWTEPLFVVCVNIALLTLVGAARAGRFSAGTVAAVVLVVNVAGLLRWAALFIVPAVAIVGLLVQPKTHSLPQRTAHAAGLALACSGTVVAGMVGNVLFGLPPMGVRSPRELSVLAVLAQFPESVAAYLGNDRSAAHVGVGLVVAIALAAFVVQWLRQADRGVAVRAVPLVAWIGTYVVVMQASALRTDLDEFGFRLSLPIVSAAVILVACGLRWALPKPVLVPAALGMLGWMAVSTGQWVVEAATTGALPVVW